MTVTANTGPGAATNALVSLAFGTLDNAVVDIVGGQSNVTSNQTITLGPGVTSQQFFVRRTTAGVAATVPLVVTDVCGAWLTFVGGGPSAFQAPDAVRRWRGGAAQPTTRRSVPSRTARAGQT